MLRYWWPENDPKDSILQDYETLIRSARRCAYDLDHVVTALEMVDPDHFFIKECDFSARARTWVHLFAKGNPGKDYRMNMHREVDRLEQEIQELTTKLKAYEQN